MNRPLVTVKSLLAQARDGREIVLADEALVTPAAEEWLTRCGLPVRRMNAPSDANTLSPTLCVVGDAAHPRLRTLLPMIERRFGPVTFRPCHGHRKGLLAALAQTCDALAGCSRRKGIVIVRDGALSQCVANKREGVRAAIISRPSQLFELVRGLGVNLLILEHESVSLRQMQAIIERFVSMEPSIDPLLELALGPVPASSLRAVPDPTPTRGC
jgi:hypothetical protein